MESLCSSQSFSLYLSVFIFRFLPLLVEFDIGLTLFFHILQGSPCAAAFMPDTKHNQLRFAHHGPVSGLVGIFVVAPCSSFTYFDFIVVIPEGFFIVPVLSCELGQHPDVGAVIAALFPLAAPYDGGNDLIKLSIPPKQELNIFVLPEQCQYELFQPAFYFQRIVDHAMPKEGNCKHFHILLLQIHNC